MLNSDIIELREKLKEFYSQRIQLELGLEIIHHDATYSESLITLIQQEEALIKRSNINNQLSVKIDDQLKLENHKYFANSTLENLRKWREYKRKIEIERLQLNNSFDNSHIKALSDDNTFNILELENKRIEEDYNKNWLYYEGFHLEEAFKFQAEKFESDWNHQEHKFKEEFNTQKQELFDIKNDFLQPTNQSKSNFTTFPSLDSHKISKSQNVVSCYIYIF